MRNLAKLFWAVPAAILGLSFLVICFHFGTAWPWSAVVHEDGRRTLASTVFYFEHALGELPLDILLAAAVAGSMLWFHARARDGRAGPFAAMAILLDIAIAAGAMLQVGASVAVRYLLQFHKRDDDPLVFGSHWRYHLISQAALMMLAFVLAGAVASGIARPRRALLAGTWALFAILTLGFGLGSPSFTDPRYLGHQARELFTHSLVTLPLAVAICAGRNGVSAGGLRPGWPWIAASAGFLLLSAYLAVAVVVTRSQHLAQSSDWVKVVCGHFFEHALGYLVVPLHAVWFYRSFAAAERQA